MGKVLPFVKPDHSEEAEYAKALKVAMDEWEIEQIRQELEREIDDEEMAEEFES